MDSNYPVGLYLRSATMNDESIETQKAMLEKWCCDNGISNVSVYADNGYSGTNYNRPSFRKLLDDVKSEKIDMVVTTDLSRIGRDLTLTNEYLSVLSSKARYVAVKDGIDSSMQSSIIEALIKISAANGKRKRNG